MNIVFNCHACASRFEVAPELAGKSARCKHCGERLTIPQPGAPSRLPRREPVAAAAKGNGTASGGDGRAPSWLASAPSNVALAPLTADRLPALRRDQAAALGLKKGPLDNFDENDRDPYALAEPAGGFENRGRASAPVGKVKMFYRREVGRIQRFFRWVNETGYLISIPFIMLILVGAIFKHRDWALFGATLVILLNVVRIAAGLANIAVIPFRDSPIQGVLCLFPPFTVLYVMFHWTRTRKAAIRLIDAIATIALVVAAFTFVPTLRGDEPPSGSVVERLKSEAGELKREVRGQLDKAGAPKVDVDSLQKSAGEGLDRLRKGASEIGGPAPEN